MNKEIIIGTVVMLKSGGPEMTVRYIDTLGILACTWMGDFPPEQYKGNFHPDTLIKLRD